MLRSSLFALLSLAAPLFVAGCQYGDGSPCEIAADCSSGICCGATGTVRGVCRPVGSTCAVTSDTGVPEDSAVDAGADGGTDTGTDSGSPDTGMPDAPEDAGADDTGVDAGLTDSGLPDGGPDSGVDAP